MKPQEIYDKVKEHLLKQGARSLLVDNPNGTCAYRGGNGAMCAAGILIKDEHYDEELETKSTVYYKVSAALRKSGIDVDKEEVKRLVENLQELHDGIEPENWERAFNELSCADMSTDNNCVSYLSVRLEKE